MECRALKIVVIDDDPTGSQTCTAGPLLLRWDPADPACRPCGILPLVLPAADTAPWPRRRRRPGAPDCRALETALAPKPVWSSGSGEAAVTPPCGVNFPLGGEVIDRSSAPSMPLAGFRPS